MFSHFFLKFADTKPHSSPQWWCTLPRSSRQAHDATPHIKSQTLNTAICLKHNFDPGGGWGVAHYSGPKAFIGLLAFVLPFDHTRPPGMEMQPDTASAPIPLLIPCSGIYRCIYEPTGRHLRPMPRALVWSQPACRCAVSGVLFDPQPAWRCGVSGVLSPQVTYDKLYITNFEQKNKAVVFFPLKIPKHQHFSLFCIIILLFLVESSVCGTSRISECPLRVLPRKRHGGFYRCWKVSVSFVGAFFEESIFYLILRVQNFDL